MPFKKQVTSNTGVASVGSAQTGNCTLLTFHEVIKVDCSLATCLGDEAKGTFSDKWRLVIPDKRRKTTHKDEPEAPCKQREAQPWMQACPYGPLVLLFSCLLHEAIKCF